MTLLDAMINDFPSWGYLPMLVLALLTSMLVADGGLRVCVSLLTRLRRQTLGS